MTNHDFSDFRENLFLKQLMNARVDFFDVPIYDNLLQENKCVRAFGTVIQGVSEIVEKMIGLISFDPARNDLIDECVFE